MAKEGVMREQGFRAKERYVPLSYPSAPQTRAARLVLPSFSSWQLRSRRQFAERRVACLYDPGAVVRMTKIEASCAQKSSG